jgi:flagellar hook protein FlgE
MLRSLYSGISGLRSHQTMLDVTANNIANVNTVAFKASATQFEDTLSQLTKGASSPQATVGGTNPAQIGLGVKVAGISTNFAQGSTQATGRALDVMISGDGFFVTSSGGQTAYTRAGALNVDPQGRFVTPDGAIIQGWSAVNGAIDTGGPIGDVTLPKDAVSPAIATTTAKLGGNLPGDAATGTVLTRDMTVYDTTGNATQTTLAFTKTAAGWDASYTDAGSPPVTTTTAMVFTAGKLTSGTSLTAGGVAVDLSGATGYAGLTTATISDQNGRDAGTLQSYTLSPDGTLVGSFSNGASQAIGQIALATFVNPGGLEKAGSSSYTATFNSGTAQIGVAGQSGIGSLTSGALEMSNVDLSQEFTNLIVAQRGFQANARIITTSDQVLQELTNLKQ